MTDVNVADYRVIRDAPVTLTLNGNSEESFRFRLPDDIPSDSRGCVWWVDRNTGGNDHVDYVVTLNGDDIRPAPPPFYRVEAPFFYTRHETFSAERLNAGAANTLEVRVLDGAGTLEVADFILAFKKTIDD